jgi:general secretion pathway protein D
MNIAISKRGSFRFVLLVLVLLTAGCAGHRAFVSGEDLAVEGKYDQAVAQFFQAVQQDPGNAEYRMKLTYAREKASWDHMNKGRSQLEKQNLEAAVAEFQAAAEFNPTLEAARQALNQARQRLDAQKLLAEAGSYYQARKLAQAKNAVNQALELTPGDPKALELLEKIKREQKSVIDGFELDVSSEKPITLKFKDTDIHDVFNILSRLSGINFIFDEDVRPQRVTVFLENATFAQSLELLLKMNDLDKKILNSKTIILYPNTRDKQKQYQDQIIQIFYLSNIDAKKAVNLLRTMLQLRKIYVHEELNAIVIRDDPDVIKLAQQILEAADRPDSEVLFDLELVEVNHVDTLDFGPRLATYSVSGGFVTPGTTTIPTSVTTDKLNNLKFLYTLPTGTFNFQKQLSDSEILANPKIRVKNREKSKVHIGSREPIITTTTSTTGELTSSNVQYIDIGVKLDIEPNIQLDNSVIAKLNLEVSNKVREIPITGGGSALEISTTNAQTTLSLKDGEQTVLGGLIRADLVDTKDTFPILGKIPLIGELISAHKKDKNKREILLSITPHIIQNVTMPRPNVATIWSGGEDDLKAGPSMGAFAAPLAAPAEQFPPSPAPGIQPPPPLTFSAPPAEESVPQAPAAPESKASPPAAPAPEPSPAAPMGGGAMVPAGAAPMAPAPTGEALVFLTGPAQVKAGETVTYEVDIHDAARLFSAPLFLTFDPKVLGFVKAEEGDFLQQGGQPTVFATSPNPAEGQVIIGYKQTAGGSGASGNGTLYRITFRAKSPGSVMLGLDRVNFQDPAGNRQRVAVEKSMPVEVQ